MNQSINILRTNIKNDILISLSASGKSIGYDLVNDSSLLVSLMQKEVDCERSEFFVTLDANCELSLIPGNIYLLSKNKLRILFDKDSTENILFLTNQCNNACLMCSQPPRRGDDIDYYYRLNKGIIKLIPCENLTSIGVTGGEPTLYGTKLYKVLKLLVQKNPEVKIHILSNGKYFENLDNASLFKEFKENVTWGIPIHSDYYKIHDEISGCSSSYYETLKGIYNLGRIGMTIEVRIVINRLNHDRLFELSEFLFKNFPFVSHFAFMGMEYYGLAVKNYKRLWIDPLDYKEELEKAVLNLATWKMNVSIYNIPFCLLTPKLYEFSKKSISAWKVHYTQECQFCSLREECGGLFGTSRYQSSNIRAVTI